MLITFFLIIAVTPYIVANNQIFTTEGKRRDRDRDRERHREIVPTTIPTTSLLPTLTESPPPPLVVFEPSQEQRVLEPYQ